MHHRLALLALPLIALTACNGPDTVEITPAPTIANKEESLLRIAKATEAAGDTGAALDLYRQVTRQASDSMEGWMGQARIYQQLGETDAAIAAFEQALEQDADNPTLLRQLANTLIYAGNAEQALLHLETAEIHDPTDARIANTKGVALDMLGRYDAAQASFRTALEHETGSRTYIENNLAMSHLLAEQYDKAIAQLGKLLSMDKGNARLRQNLALAYGLKGEHSKALKLGLKDLPKDTAQENIDFYKNYSRRLNHLEPSAGTPTEEVADTTNAVSQAVESAAPHAEDTARKEAEVATPPAVAESIPDTADATDHAASDSTDFTVETD